MPAPALDALALVPARAEADRWACVDVSIRNASSHASLPSIRLSQLQSDWLAGARARLLRQAGIHRARSILDLACGWGQTTFDLAERGSASVWGIDLNPRAIEAARASVPDELKKRINFIHAEASKLPFDSQSFDIVFTQCSLLWIEQKELALEECRRVLKPGGCLAMIEPDYDGLMEYPSEVACRELWVHLISQSGGDPKVGRALPALCRSAGFDTNVYFLDRYLPPRRYYMEFLKELPANEPQLARIERIESRCQQFSDGELVVHLPFWLLIAKPSQGQRPSKI